MQIYPSRKFKPISKEKCIKHGKKNNESLCISCFNFFCNECCQYHLNHGLNEMKITKNYFFPKYAEKVIAFLKREIEKISTILKNNN